MKREYCIPDMKVLLIENDDIILTSNETEPLPVADVWSARMSTKNEAEW
mgnify:CR=1 FL=1